MREQIYYYAIKYQGDYSKIEHALQEEEPYEPIPITQKCLVIGDKEYPKKLYALEKPPWILFYEGNLSLLNKKSIAMVGSREVDEYGIHCSIFIAKSLSDYVLVSGMAKGVDTLAHANARYTIGIVANGLDICYPSENHALYEYMKQHQLLMSEYPLGVKPRKYYFPFRNRIISALSDALIVPSCKAQGGTMHTVEEALRLDIPIYTIPHPMLSKLGEGCNLLIEQGANMLYTYDDIEEVKKGLTNEYR